MIERIPRHVPAPSVSLLRAFLSINGISPARRHPRRLQCPRAFSKRCYATSGLPIHRNTPQQQTLPTEPLSGAHESRQEGQQQQPPPRKKRNISFRPLIWATTGLIIGMLAGKFVTVMISPPAMPEPGSPEDLLLINDIQSRASKIPIVQQLSASPDWKSWDAYNSYDASSKEKHLTAEVLDGARAIGAYQRIFWNERTGEVVSVIWIGGSVSGWPGVTHGGLLATIFDESLARCAMIPRKSGVVTASLNLTYRNPTPTHSYYVIKTWPIAEGSTDRKAYIAGSLEEPNGKVCVEAKGLFVVPKHVKMLDFADKVIGGF